jgi:hypothetical protein
LLCPQRDNPSEITLCYLTGQAFRYLTGQAIIILKNKNSKYDPPNKFEGLNRIEIAIPAFASLAMTIIN